MKKQLLFLFPLLFFGSFNLLSQGTYQIGYGSAESDRAHALVETSDGNFVITGAFEGDHIYSSKITPLGDTLWTRKYNLGDSLGKSAKDGGLGGTAFDIAECFNGDLIVCGVGYDLVSHGSEDVFLMRITSDGDTLWAKGYGGLDEEYGYSVVQLSDSTFLVAGTAESFGVLSRDGYVLHLDAQGDTLQTLLIGGSGVDGFESIIEVENGNFLAVGYTFSEGAGNSDVFVVKLDPNGNILWEKTYGGASNEFGRSVIATTLGYVIAGSTESFGSGLEDAYLVNIDVNGSLLWSRSYGGTSFDGANSLIQTTDNGFALAGYIESAGAGFWDILLLKTDSLGQLSWSKAYGTANFDYGQDLLQTLDSGYLISGYSDGFYTGDNDIYIIKTDSIGLSSCQTMNGNLVQADPVTIVTTSSSNVVSASSVNTLEQAFSGEPIEFIDACDSTLGVDDILSAIGLLMYPNPTSGGL
ncbi:MAG: hypothetical protein ACI837_003568, partial [Crocinitomicaceae bacterium]